MNSFQRNWWPWGILTILSLVILFFQLKPFARPRRESKPRRVPA